MRRPFPAENACGCMSLLLLCAIFPVHAHMQLLAMYNQSQVSSKLRDQVCFIASYSAPWRQIGTLLF